MTEKDFQKMAQVFLDLHVQVVIFDYGSWRVLKTRQNKK
jgi:hypothetical protein